MRISSSLRQISISLNINLQCNPHVHRLKPQLRTPHTEKLYWHQPTLAQYTLGKQLTDVNVGQHVASSFNDYRAKRSTIFMESAVIPGVPRLRELIVGKLVPIMC